MEFKATEIATFLNGEIVGDGNVKIFSVSKIEEGKPGTLASLSYLKYESHIYKTEASVVLVNKNFKPKESLPTFSNSLIANQKVWVTPSLVLKNASKEFSLN